MSKTRIHGGALRELPAHTRTQKRIQRMHEKPNNRTQRPSNHQHSTPGPSHRMHKTPPIGRDAQTFQTPGRESGGSRQTSDKQTRPIPAIVQEPHLHIPNSDAYSKRVPRAANNTQERETSNPQQKQHQPRVDGTEAKAYISRTPTAPGKCHRRRRRPASPDAPRTRSRETSASSHSHR